MVFWPGCSFPVRFIASSISRLAACSGLFYHLSAFFWSREMFLCAEILCQGKDAGRYHIPTYESFDDVYDLQFTSHMKRTICSHLKFSLFFTKSNNIFLWTQYVPAWNPFILEIFWIIPTSHKRILSDNYVLTLSWSRRAVKFVPSFSSGHVPFPLCKL